MDKCDGKIWYFKRNYQGWLFIAILLLITGSVSMYANRANSSDLHTGGRMIIQIGSGINGSYDPFMFHSSPYLGYWFHSPCYPFATCAAFHQYQSNMRREQRLRRLRDQSEQKAFGVLPFTQQRNTKLYRTDENEILPGARGYSQIRSEYKDAGEYRSEFLEKPTSAERK